MAQLLGKRYREVGTELLRTLRWEPPRFLRIPSGRRERLGHPFPPPLLHVSRPDTQLSLRDEFFEYLRALPASKLLG